MARAARTVGTLPLVGALATATALTGAALFTVAQGPCTDAGQFVQRGGELELVGSCLTPNQLPGGTEQQQRSNRQHGAYGEEHLSP